MSGLAVSNERVVIDVATKFSGGTRYSATAWHKGKFFETKASSTSAAATRIAAKLRKSDPKVTHIRIDGFEMALEAEGVL